MSEDHEKRAELIRARAAYITAVSALVGTSGGILLTVLQTFF